MAQINPQSPFKSIQVQTTVCTGKGVEMVTYTKPGATHWSFYGRLEDGTVQWLKDIPVSVGSSDQYFGPAMVEAAKLSMEHGAPIEQVF